MNETCSDWIGSSGLWAPRDKKVEACSSSRHVDEELPNLTDSDWIGSWIRTHIYSYKNKIIMSRRVSKPTLFFLNFAQEEKFYDQITYLEG